MAIPLYVIEDIFKNIFGALSMTVIRIFSALLIFLIGFIIGKVLGRLIHKALEELELNNFLKGTLHIKINAENMISTSFSYLVYFLALIAALEQVGVANLVLYAILVIFILMVLMSFFLATRDFVPNFMAGIYLYSKEQLRPGSSIEIKDIKGEITQIDLLHIKIKTAKGDIIYMPNSIAASSEIKIRKPKTN